MKLRKVLKLIIILSIFNIFFAKESHSNDVLAHMEKYVVIDKELMCKKYLQDDIIGMSFFNPKIKKSKNKIDNFLIYKKRQISYKELYTITESIVKDLPEIKAKPDLIRLVVETAITETDGGFYYNTTNKGGLGITQINYKTAKELLNSVRKNKEEIAQVLENYKNKEMTLRENLIHNLTFNIALCTVYYYYNRGNNLYKNIKTLDKRAKLWKQVYNTSKGKGTPEIYKKRVINYNPQEKMLYVSN